MQEIPKWLKDLVAANKAAFHTAPAAETKDFIDGLNLHTVCKEARCPNRGECFKNRDATVMILGGICTRRCKFCAVDKTCAPLPPDEGEPARVAQLAQKLGARYLVLTMPTRDDLADGGAKHTAAVINEVTRVLPFCKTEPLISDLKGNFDGLSKILAAKPAVLAHNIETVPALYAAVRIGADYTRSLNLLEQVKKLDKNMLTKSGIMLGLGETEAQLKDTLKDLRAAGCDLLTLGQYLAPSKAHYPVHNYPEQSYYDALTIYAKSIGFKGIMAGPLVRSSYRAGALYLEGVKNS